MTQKSYPWPGVAPASGPDAGRYLAPEWWAVWAALNRAGGIIVPAAVNPLRTDTTLANIGVIYAIPNRLAVTDAGGFVASVATGGALVDGAFEYNDATVSLTMPASQTYYVVLRKNFTAATYTPPGYVAGDGTVPAYSTRVTWVSALVQSTDRTTYWDIPLATVITDGSEITTVTDTREYVDAETKTVLIPIEASQNVTDSTDPLTSEDYGLWMLDNKESRITGHWTTPEDYISGMTIAMLVDPGGSGNFYGRLTTWFGAIGESVTTHSGGMGVDSTEAVTSGQFNSIFENSVSNVSKGDYFILWGKRRADDPNDTIGANVFALGFVITYFGWK